MNSRVKDIINDNRIKLPSDVSELILSYTPRYQLEYSLKYMQYKKINNSNKRIFKWKSDKDNQQQLKEKFGKNPQEIMIIDYCKHCGEWYTMKFDFVSICYCRVTRIKKIDKYNHSFGDQQEEFDFFWDGLDTSSDEIREETYEYMTFE